MPVITLANGRSFAASGATLLDAALAHGLALEHSCRTGRCGSCKVRVLQGRSMPVFDETSLTAAEIAGGWILTCARHAQDDLSLDTEDLAELVGIVPKTFPCRIDALDLVAPDVMAVRLRLPPNAGLAFLAGQYIDITGPGGVRRSYSIASPVTSASKLDLHVRRVDGGELSRYWFDEARIDDLLRFRGPLGTFFLRSVAGLDLIFFATGTGYAPICSMLAQLATLPDAEGPRSASLLWGARAALDFYADPTIASAFKGIEFIPVLSRPDNGWFGERGHIQDVLLRRRAALDQAVVYACGSNAMIQSAKAALTAAGLPAKRFYADAFVSSS